MDLENQFRERLEEILSTFLKDSERGSELLESLLAEPSLEDYPSLHSIALRRKADILRLGGHVELAFHYSDLCLSIESANPIALAANKLARALLEADYGDNEKALRLSLDARSTFIKFSDLQSEGQSEETIAHCLLNLGIFERSLTHLERCIELYRQAQLERLPGAMMLLAFIYAHIGAVPKAIEVGREAATLAVEVENFFLYTLLQINLSAYALELNDLPLADQELALAWQRLPAGAEMLGRLVQVANAKILLQKAKFDNALSELDWTDDRGKDYAWTEGSIVRSLVLAKVGQIETASRLLSEVKESCKNELHRTQVLEAELELAVVSVDWHRVYLKQAELNSRLTAMHSKELNARIHTKDILEELAREKEQLAINALTQEHLQRELHTTTTALLAQTELLANFRDEIRAAVRKLPPTEPVVKELKEKLKALPCESVDWERFDAQFKAAHPEFVKNLTLAHPELTSMELRICSLLRSSLKSQDIGRLLCLSDRTVENHRFNIRKKLELARSIDLKVYLQRF